MKPSELPLAWRDEAARLRERYGLNDLAALSEAHAIELEEALAAAEDELLPPSAAAKVSGLSERTLRERRAKGQLVARGTPARPLYRRGDLPKRARGGAGGWDATEHVAGIVGAS